LLLYRVENPCPANKTHFSTLAVDQNRFSKRGESWRSSQQASDVPSRGACDQADYVSKACQEREKSFLEGIFAGAQLALEHRLYGEMKVNSEISLSGARFFIVARLC
jgi:hypothetical protein